MDFADLLPSQAQPFVKISNRKQELSYTQLQPSIDKASYKDSFKKYPIRMSWITDKFPRQPRNERFTKFIVDKSTKILFDSIGF